MQKKNAIILSYTILDSDPRVLRQIAALEEDFKIVTVSIGPVKNSTFEFYPIYTKPAFSLARKISRSFQFITRQFDAFYWDEFKSNIVERLKVRKFDIVIANDIQPLPMALAIAGNKSKVFFDAHEYYPREFEDNLKWRLMNKRYVEYLCKKYIPQANAFSCVNENIALEYEKYLGIKPFVITNASDYKDLKPSEVNPGKIKLVHHGAAIPSRKLELMIEMMKLTQDHFFLDIILTGKNLPYINYLKKKASGNERVRFLPPVSFNAICSFLNEYDIGIFLLPPTNFNYLHALPAKFFEFVQARLGIIVSPNPEMASLVTKHKLGMVSKDFKPQSMADTINNLTVEQIKTFKLNSDNAAKILSAEENIKKIRKVVTGLTSQK